MVLNKLAEITAWVALLLMPTVAFGGDALFHQGHINTLLQPFNHNAYGPGIHSDAAGRPFEYRTYDYQQQAVPGNVPVTPNAYGLGVGMDAYGRPVRAYPK